MYWHRDFYPSLECSLQQQFFAFNGENVVNLMSRICKKKKKIDDIDLYSLPTHKAYQGSMTLGPRHV